MKTGVKERKGNNSARTKMSKKAKWFPVWVTAFCVHVPQWFSLLHHKCVYWNEPKYIWRVKIFLNNPAAMTDVPCMSTGKCGQSFLGGLAGLSCMHNNVAKPMEGKYLTAWLSGRFGTRLPDDFKMLFAKDVLDNLNFVSLPPFYRSKIYNC